MGSLKGKVLDGVTRMSMVGIDLRMSSCLLWCVAERAVTYPACYALETVLTLHALSPLAAATRN